MSVINYIINSNNNCYHLLRPTMCLRPHEVLLCIISFKRLNNLFKKVYYYPYLMVKIRKVRCLRSHTGKWWGQNSNPESYP